MTPSGLLSRKHNWQQLRGKLIQNQLSSSDNTHLVRILYLCNSMLLCGWNSLRNLHTPPICMTYTSHVYDILLSMYGGQGDWNAPKRRKEKKGEDKPILRISYCTFVSVTSAWATLTLGHARHEKFQTAPP